jgi:hypothetical protein
MFKNKNKKNIIFNLVQAKFHNKKNLPNVSKVIEQ